MRLAFLQLVTLLGVLLVAITELLSALHRLERLPLLILWFGAMACAAVVVIRRGRRFDFALPRADPVVLLCVAGCAGIFILTAVTAILSPPNSADAMAYHLPRVVYWAEQSSVRFFPTPYLNQIMLQPFAEYVALHLYILSGGDFLVNLIQWCASVVAVLAASLAAARFGANPRGQAIAALFCATLPSGILASSGAKNDYVLAMWILIAVCFAMRFGSSATITDALFLGAASGLALLTKATAYLFLPWLIGAIIVIRWRPRSTRALGAGAGALLCALAINAPHYVRNVDLSGGILGYDSADGTGMFRWRNETFGWKPTVSNAVRNLSEQLGARSERWNHGVYEAALAVHSALAIDVDDRLTTWRWTKYGPPRNANHEADAGNRWHLLLLVIFAGVLAVRAWRGEDRERALYAAALVLGFLSFCAYLKWQPFSARLFLPLFVAGSPIAGILGELRPNVAALLVQVPLCLFLVDNARLPLLANWVRPLRGPRSVFAASRNEQYFADMSQWNNRESYLRSVDLIAHTGCDSIGIDATNLQLEYPLMVMLRQQIPGVRFVHTGVANRSRLYPPPVDKPPCVIACLDCAGDPARLNLYAGMAQNATFGKFVILTAGK